MSPEGLEDLANSIREFGVIEPVLVTRLDGGYVLIAGERRLVASRQAGLATIPAIVRSSDAEERLAIALIENIQRENLNAVDEALAYKRLQEAHSLTQEEISARVGKSRVAVANSIRLLQLPAAILEDVSRGTLSAGHARALLSVKSEAAREGLWKLIRDKGLSVRAAEDAARALEAAGDETEMPNAPRDTPSSRTDGSSTDANTRFLEDRLREALGTQVRIHGKGKSGKIEIEYYSYEDLDRLIGLLGVRDIF